MANYYLCPSPWKTDRDHLSGWAKEFLQSGLSFLKAQPAYPFIQESLQLVNGDLFTSDSNNLSDVKTGVTVRNLKELIASQTNLRIIPAFKTELPEFQHQQVLLNKLYMAWQLMTMADRSLRKVWQYAGALGTGYAGLRWEPDFWYKGKGDIVMDTYGPTDVIPVGLPKNFNLQQAYGVAVRVNTPIHLAWRKFPEYRDLIVPSRSGTKLKGGVVSEAVKLMSGVLARFNPAAAQEKDNTPWETVDLYYIYLDDDTINESDEKILMGTPGTSWEYTVPPLGSDIFTRVDSKTGAKEYRKAVREDSLLYPNKRLVICTEEGEVLNPNPAEQVNPYWGGKVPIVQFKGDDWPWSFLGFPLTKDGIDIEKANVSMFRAMVDAVNARLAPARMYDRNTMAKSLAESINPRVPNTVVGLDMTFGGEQLKPLLPSDYYNIPNAFIDFLKQNEGRIGWQMGVADASALARARQVPAGDSTERILEAMGPLIKDMSRSMEAGVRDLGELWKHLVFQFYHAPRRMQYLGEKGITPEDFQYTPSDLIPEVVPGAPPSAGRFDRAKLHAGNFTFSVTPYSLHEMNSVTRKLFHLQLIRAGFPIDWWTLADVFDLKEFGKKPLIPDPEHPGQTREAETILERFLAQREIMARMGAAEGGGKGKDNRGRPPSGQTSPAMEQKNSGSRSIIRESRK